MKSWDASIRRKLESRHSHGKRLLLHFVTHRLGVQQIV